MADPLAPLHKVQAAARHKFSENIPEGTKSTSNKEYRKPAAERSKRTAAPKRGSKEKHGKGALPQLDTAKLEHLFKAADAVGLFSATSQSAASKPAAQPDPLQSISFDTLRISSPRETADMRSAAAAQLTYSQRCQMESDALLAACPPHLRHVSQTYLKQAEAFALADQCNRGMPVLPEPEIILSADSCAPAPTRPGSSAVPSGPVAQPAQQKPAQDLPEQEKPAENADMSNSKHNEGLFANVPSFYTRPKAADPTLEADGAEEPPRQKQQKTEEAAATAQTRAEKYRELLAAVNASIQAPGAHLDAGTEPPAQSPLPAGAVGAGAPANGATAAPERGGSPGNAPPVERREEAIRVFCVEKANERTGAYYRTFTAASYSWVWSTYLATAPKDLHYYEIIREGRACHLYFDLEYARGPTLNAAVDGDALVDKLLLHVEATLRRGFNLPLDRNCIYELDSSTPQKFSRHLIVRIPGHAFAHNLAVGDFVNQVLAASGDDLTVDKAPAVTTPPLAGEGSITALPQAQQQAQPPQRTWFVDTAVYTRNRHFRLAYSCKGGKTAVLCPTQRFAAALGPNRPSPAKVFLDTLITNVDPAAKLLLVRSPREGLGHGGGRERGGVVTVPLDGHRLAWKVDNTDGPPGPQGDGKKEALRKLAEAALPFIERVATQRAGQEARARTMAFCGFDGTVAYSMIGPGSHYCENIGRPHKANHVYFVANFSSGKYAQKCHDPECAKYRSAWMPFPEELCLKEDSNQHAMEPQPQESA